MWRMRGWSRYASTVPTPRPWTARRWCRWRRAANISSTSNWAHSRSDMANLTLKGIRKSFNGSTILHGIDLDIADGEFVVFVGPSGCGKSTLLRSICGLEDIDSGEIALAGRRVDQLPPAERQMAMVFQSYALYPHMTVFE